MSEQIELSEAEYALWRELHAGGGLEVSALVESTHLQHGQITAMASQARERGYIEIQERPREELVPAVDAAARLEEGLPERRAIAELARRGGALPVPELVAWARDCGVAVHEVFRWGQARGWLRRERLANVEGDPGRVVLSESGRAAVDEPDDDEQALRLAVEGRLFLDELPGRGLDQERARRLLKNRSELARIKRRTERILSLTETGVRAMEAGVRVKRERNALTPEDIRSGAWREITLRPYDVTLPAAEIRPAKIHPLRKIIEQTRQAFLQMGFTEVVSPMVESAFWNFDALFQPQDHPARDMQDTFYMAEPAQGSLPDEGIVQKVRRTHEDGWETGSVGWGYRWDPEQARRLVLRTHTTAATIRALARHPGPPLKVFSVGWTYRNETISYKHLPVFHQVDGVVIDEEANLATLLGTLRRFYEKMGFERIKFKPAFYPYTEPSADAVVYMPSRGEWIEMGGSGIFRPEVTLPFGCRHGVLAWGLGIERIAMLRFGFESLRDLYEGSLDRIQEVGLCR